MASTEGVSTSEGDDFLVIESTVLSQATQDYKWSRIIPHTVEDLIKESCYDSSRKMAGYHVRREGGPDQGLHRGDDHPGSRP